MTWRSELLQRLQDVRGNCKTRNQLYAINRTSPSYLAARHLREQAQLEDAGFCIATQILTEFYSTVTNPRRFNPPLTVEQAAQEVENIKTLAGVIRLPLPLDVADLWLSLVRQYRVSRSDIYDTLLVATMLENQVRRIYTFNVDDFRLYPDIEVLVPPAP